ncbi:MAG: AbiV family abortive infection protein [Candidatus Thorarchaeota archaeon]|jgi:AbiV family abortive infection protein
MNKKRRPKGEPDKIIRAMSESLINAKQFLTDSKLLAQGGSIGHATSLAVLGFEEAHKAYLLIQLLPAMELYFNSRQKRDVRRQLDRHSYKLTMAIGFQAFFQYMAYKQGSPTEKERLETKLSEMKNLRESKEDLSNRLGSYLNTLKNKGFYVEPGFGVKSFWSPSEMLSSDLEDAIQLLESHIALVQDIVEFYMDPDFLIPDDVHNEVSKVTRVLGSQRGKRLNSLRKDIEEAGEVGEFIKGFIDFLVKYYIIIGGPKKKRKR